MWCPQSSHRSQQKTHHSSPVSYVVMWREYTVTSEFPYRRTRNVESVSIPWCSHILWASHRWENYVQVIEFRSRYKGSHMTFIDSFNLECCSYNFELKYLFFNTFQGLMSWAFPTHCQSGVCQRTLTHWGRVTHICVNKLTMIGSDNGLSPGRRQAIIWTNAGILLIGPLGTNFSKILIEI